MGLSKQHVAQRQRLNVKRIARKETLSLSTFFIAFAFKSSLLSLLTSHRAAGSRNVCIAKVEEDGQMGRLIPVTSSKRRIVNFIAAMRIHTPFIWTLGHDQKSSTFSIFAHPKHQVPKGMNDQGLKTRDLRKRH